MYCPPVALWGCTGACCSAGLPWACQRVSAVSAMLAWVPSPRWRGVQARKESTGEGPRVHMALAVALGLKMLQCPSVEALGGGVQVEALGGVGVGGGVRWWHTGLWPGWPTCGFVARVAHGRVCGQGGPREGLWPGWPTGGFVAHGWVCGQGGPRVGLWPGWPTGGWSMGAYGVVFNSGPVSVAHVMGCGC